MTCLYRINDEICIELSYEALRVVERLVRDKLLEQLFPASQETWSDRVFPELSNFANMVRAHLQHSEPAGKLAPVITNSDLI
jgi:hypothetical protein